MKNKLYIYGCSYSELVDERGYLEYIKWRNYEPIKTWSEILAKKLNLNLINRAQGALCNEIIFQKFCNDCNYFNEGDVVIIEWSFFNRYSWIDIYDNLISCSTDGYKDSITLNCAEQISVARTHSAYKKQIIDFQKLIDDYLNLKGIKVWYWHADPSAHEYIDLNDKRYLLIDEIMKNNDNFQRCTFDVVYELGGCDIETETNGVVKDNHFGELAHKIKAELFYEHIKKYENLV